ncbi:lipopolysaccharide heptosyltransferase I [Thauera aromatica]|uniref:lipopolysaccharide heptosyltransferase I n=1 Tax=Thauera aromatica TaxID=59405 RepID=UPI001FFC472E|nr:lipopolysaccharide heptosyltransferase I [Thauera aromatica]MCK2096996.1 lipopolysaccharide heptosyltransferase I [Thauera aromatica]
MQVLIVKTSSLGDVIHTLPALTDAARALPGIRFDWVVEEGFAEIPRWHPAVDRVIPVAVRRWRKHPLRAWRSGEWRAFTAAIGARRYDAVIDAQGLLKSAWLARHAHGPVHGLDRHSAREPLASCFYRHRHAVAWGRHAVLRVRELFARALGYALPDRPDAAADPYGLDRARVLAGAAQAAGAGAPYLVFLHGTTWATKHWPELYWRRLAERACAAGWQVRLPWGNDTEHARAERLAEGLAGARVLPRLTLAGVAAEIAGAHACIAVDTGLGHLAAALAVPTVSVYGPTNPGFTGAWGAGQRHLASDFACAPCLRKRCRYTPGAADRARPDFAREQPLCFTRLAPERVWVELAAVLDRNEAA